MPTKAAKPDRLHVLIHEPDLRFREMVGRRFKDGTLTHFASTPEDVLLKCAEHRIVVVCDVGTMRRVMDAHPNIEVIVHADANGRRDIELAGAEYANRNIFAGGIDAAIRRVYKRLGRTP